MERFIAGDETVLDTQTGLMWVKNAGLTEFPLTWQEAFLFIKELNESGFGGYDDWKLPNRKELFSLISREMINPSLPTKHPFEEVFSGYYWTSTTCARLPDQAWYIHLGGAKVYRGMKHGSYMVWPVRVSDKKGSRVLKTGQQACFNQEGLMTNCQHTGQDGEFQAGITMPNPRFSYNGEVIFDKATGLTWTKPADCFGGLRDWHAALNRVKQMNQENPYGFNDWRIPEIEELESLTDMGQHSPALPENHPFLSVQEFYWSSTTSMYNPDYAWVLYLQDGAVGVGYKPLSDFYCWMVRGTFVL